MYVHRKLLSCSGSAGDPDCLHFELADYEAVQREVVRCGHSAAPRLQLLGQWGAVPAATLSAIRSPVHPPTTRTTVHSDQDTVQVGTGDSC